QKNGHAAVDVVLSQTAQELPSPGVHIEADGLSAHLVEGLEGAGDGPHPVRLGEAAVACIPGEDVVLTVVLLADIAAASQVSSRIGFKGGQLLNGVDFARDVVDSEPGDLIADGIARTALAKFVAETQLVGVLAGIDDDAEIQDTGGLDEALEVFNIVERAALGLVVAPGVHDLLVLLPHG